MRIRHKGIDYFLGPFDTPLEAAKARDQKARNLFGPYAWLNFPDESPSDAP